MSAVLVVPDAGRLAVRSPISAADSLDTRRFAVRTLVFPAQGLFRVLDVTFICGTHEYRLQLWVSAV
jgi:hypothetical protein